MDIDNHLISKTFSMPVHDFLGLDMVAMTLGGAADELLVDGAYVTGRDV